MKTLYVYVDESGNFDFTAKGTRHLVLSVLCTTNPVKNSLSLAKLKYGLMAQGRDLSNFHASEDLQQVRDLVFLEVANLKSCSAITFWVAKENYNSVRPGAVGLYKTFGKHIAKHVAELASEETFDNVVVVFDKALVRKDQNSVLAALRPQLAAIGVSHHVYFHHVSKDFNGQIADYLAWAIYVSLERDEFRPRRMLPEHLNGVFEIRDSN
jgi:hypothetical protein